MDLSMRFAIAFFQDYFPLFPSISWCFSIQVLTRLKHYQPVTRAELFIVTMTSKALFYCIVFGITNIWLRMKENFICLTFSNEAT